MSNRIVALGSKGPIYFPNQFRAEVDGRSLAVTPLEFFDMNGEILETFHATAFFYRLDGRVYLVSARHALTGLDAFEDKPFSKTNYLPDMVRVYPCIRGEEHHSRIELNMAVREKGVATWLEDPEFKQLNTDIACIEIHHAQKDDFLCLEVEQDAELYAAIGFECFVAGYPNRNYLPPFAPIWRRGSFAYEPMLPVHDRPIFLVDAMTSQGFSGSPIFQRTHGPAAMHKENGELEVNLESVVATRFVGVYGGRLDHENQMAQVGYGWYSNRIPMIVNQKAEVLPGKPVAKYLEANFNPDLLLSWDLNKA